jgi:hypothetical protein
MVGLRHAVLAQSAAQFYEPSLTDWLLKEVATAKGDAKDALPPAAYPSAIKLMNASQVRAVGDAVNKISGPATEKEAFKEASKVVEKCKETVACYLQKLDEPVPSTPATAKMGHVKATYMAAIYGNAQTRGELVNKLEKVKDPTVRFSMAEAIDHLAPQGDVQAAEKMEKLVESDKASGNKPLEGANDSVYKIALKLRSRATP